MGNRLNNIGHKSEPTNQGLKGLTEDDEDMFMEKQGEEPLEEDGLSVAEQGEQQEENDDRNVDTELNSDLAEKADGKQNINKCIVFFYFIKIR